MLATEHIDVLQHYWHYLTVPASDTMPTFENAEEKAFEAQVRDKGLLHVSVVSPPELLNK